MTPRLWQANCAKAQPSDRSSQKSRWLFVKASGHRDMTQRLKKRLVYICDWLPPDFGAVGQYALLFARAWAQSGWEVTLVGLTSGEPRRDPVESVGEGTLEVIRAHRPIYEKQKLVERLRWTIVSNLVLL